jgi:hypothetical protein
MKVIRFDKTYEYLSRVTEYLPDRIRIFMAATYVWAVILFYIVKFANIMLGLIIMYLPTLFLPRVNPKNSIKILKAVDDRGNEITKQLNMFMLFKWDKEMCDDKGGIDLDKFTDYIGSTLIWVAYILDYDISEDSCKQFLSFLPPEAFEKTPPDECESDQDDNSDRTKTSVLPHVNCIKKCIRYIFINTSKRIMYKLKKSSDEIIAEDIVFGEVNFF